MVPAMSRILCDASKFGTSVISYRDGTQASQLDGELIVAARTNSAFVDTNGSHVLTVFELPYNFFALSSQSCSGTCYSEWNKSDEK